MSFFSLFTFHFSLFFRTFAGEMSYQQLWRRLAQHYDEGEAKAIARLVFEVRYGLTLADILLGKDTQLSADDQAELEEIAERLQQNEPVQYVLGQADFCGRSFYVAPGVLIPRPETAEICNYLLAADLKSTAKILDIGTGSGCIAITLAAEMPEAEVTAWDISMKSLEIAKKNALRHHVDIHFQQVNILHSALNTQQSPAIKFDLIVSNPPYICEKEKGEMEAHVVNYEPEIALFVPDNDPLLFYRAIAHHAIKALNLGGLLAVEINRAYGKETCELFKNIGFNDITLHTDSFGNHRFVTATL